MLRHPEMVRYAAGARRRVLGHPAWVRLTTGTRRRASRALRRPEGEPPVVKAAISRFTHADGMLVADGWAFADAAPVVAIGVDSPSRRRLVPGYGRSSPDVALQYGAKAARCRFHLHVRWPSAEDASQAHLYVRLADGREADLEGVLYQAMSQHRFGGLWLAFLQALRERPSGRVLELGSRGEGGTVYRAQIPPEWDYVGFDIVEGPNVDVVGDAHQLSAFVEPESFDALFSIATFEHLAMPWKVAVEINKVLKPGGVAVVVSHQCWPVHEQPWDFWRFSTWAWRTMFNEASGFEVVEAAMGEPARVVPELLQPVTAGVADGVAYLGSAALVRKIGPTGLSWEVPTEAAAEGNYPVP